MKKTGCPVLIYSEVGFAKDPLNLGNQKVIRNCVF